MECWSARGHGSFAGIAHVRLHTTSKENVARLGKSRRTRRVRVRDAISHYILKGEQDPDG